MDAATTIVTPVTAPCVSDTSRSSASSDLPAALVTCQMLYWATIFPSTSEKSRIVDPPDSRAVRPVVNASSKVSGPPCAKTSDGAAPSDNHCCTPAGSLKYHSDRGAVRVKSRRFPATLCVAEVTGWISSGCPYPVNARFTSHANGSFSETSLNPVSGK